MLIEIHSFSFKKMHVKMLSAKWHPFCLSINVFMSPENGSFLLCSHYSGSVWYVQGQSGLVFLASHLSSQISWIPGLTHCGLVMPYSDRFGSTLAQVMAWCLTAPSHHLNQCWLCISQAQRYSCQGNFTRDTEVISCISLKFTYLKFNSHISVANELTIIWKSFSCLQFCHHSDEIWWHATRGLVPLTCSKISLLKGLNCRHHIFSWLILDWVS